MQQPPDSVNWERWGTSAFTRASHQNAPVLLSLHAAWSTASADLDQRVFEDPGVRAVVADSYVPVRVDVDLRPDIADRYGLGTWPSVLVLTPEGDTLTGGQPLDPASLVATLKRILDTFRSERNLLLEAASRRSEVPWPAPAGPDHPVDFQAPAVFVAQCAATLASSPSTSAWLDEPAVMSALLAVGLRQSGDRALELASRWIDACLERGLDDETGAFVTPAGWSPQGEAIRVALLGRNAALLDALLGGSVVLGRSDLHERGIRLANVLRREMSHPQGGFIHAWWPLATADVARRLSNDSPAGRSGRTLDRRRFVGANAEVARACLRAAAVLDDGTLGELAIATIEQVVLPCYERGAGLAHVLDPEPRGRGLLADQVSAAAALLEAFGVTEMPVYRDLAEELIRSVLRKHWRPELAALQDRVPTLAGGGDVGLMGRPYCPLSINGLAARVLLRLAALGDDPALAAQAHSILGAFGPPSAQAGADAAHYVLAVLATQDEGQEPRA